MTIKRYNSEKDNTIINALRENLTARGTSANLGSSDILEVFSIYGQASTSSLEQARILVQFPISSISADRDSGIIPASGSVKFKLKLHNTPHGQTTPKKYNLIAHPIVRPWNEGDGLDMEQYMDTEASNWISASDGVVWHSTGSDFASSSYVDPDIVPLEYKQYFGSGVEDIDIDITGITEEWIKHHKGIKTAATASINFLQNPSADQTIKICSHEGEEYFYTFIAGSSYSINNDVFLQLSGSTAATAEAFENRIRSDFAGKITTEFKESATVINLTQSAAGLHGNTYIETSAPASTIKVDGFGGGAGMPNYGLILKLRDDYENGSRLRSYYTKKFYSRSSHEFFLKPKIEAQWDSSIKDDRNYILKSSSLAPAVDNLNNIYLYNRIKGNLVDIPNTGTSIIVEFYPTLGGSKENIVQVSGPPADHVSASRESKGVYKATFAYSGSETRLYDVWSRSTNGTEVELVTGSGFTVHTDSVDVSHSTPNYVANITNLKPSYLQSEKATFRVYTRNKNWSPNVYTKATQAAPVNNIRDMYYKITKVSDNYEVISYSTGSDTSYTSLSYDKDGSYFDLDMALLQKNNAYEISFVFKDGANYIELSEKFRFRVDP